MTKNTFLKSKLNSFKPQFKDLVGLTGGDNPKDLYDFMNMLHPNQDYTISGCHGCVYGRKTYYFTLYKTGILRTDEETGNKRFYPL